MKKYKPIKATKFVQTGEEVRRLKNEGYKMESMSYWVNTPNTTTCKMVKRFK